MLSACAVTRSVCMITFGSRYTCRMFEVTRVSRLRASSFVYNVYILASFIVFYVTTNVVLFAP